tara:strand:+ start:316 stop:444 length:129 start_codon:yes stop_codon:yes gene_type:complete
MGGKNAYVDVSNSVRGRINQQISLSNDHSGVFTRFNGKKIEF